MHGKCRDTHDTRYMQNYSKLGLEQPGAGGSGSTYDEARTKGATQARVPRRRAASASEFQDTCRNSYMMNS